MIILTGKNILYNRSISIIVILLIALQSNNFVQIREIQEDNGQLSENLDDCYDLIEQEKTALQQANDEILILQQNLDNNINQTNNQLQQANDEILMLQQNIEDLNSQIYDIEHQLYPNGTIPGPGHTGDKYIVITIDVEAQPPRQTGQHVERLIYGNFTEGRAGILEMMDAADAIGAKLSFFVDILEEYLYPGEISQVLDDINSRGHDIQLHTHPEYIPENVWQQWQQDPLWDELGVERTTASNCWNQGTAEFILGKELEILDQNNISKPVAFRGGAYRYNANLLNAMADLGINNSYNYNPIVSSQQFDRGKQPIFQWENGVYEIPVSYFSSSNNQFSDRFDSNEWNDTDLSVLINEFFNEAKGDTVLVMMMHSWELLGTEEDLEDGKYNYVYDGTWRSEAFQQFLQNLPEDVNVITATELSEKINSGEFSPYWMFDQSQIANC